MARPRGVDGVFPILPVSLSKAPWKAEVPRSCFGTDRWPKDLAVPQAWIEFDVERIEEATAELERLGYKLLVAKREEPWGQVVNRLLGPEGLLVGITHAPSMPT